MKIRFLREWRQYPKGEIIDADPGLADTYLGIGVAEKFAEDVFPASPKLVLPFKRGRGRPSKFAL